MTSADLALVADDLEPEELINLIHDWSLWAREDQLEPPGDWQTWAIIGGRGSGKTRTGSEWVRANVCGSTPMTGGKYGRVALIGETAADARDVMVEGESGILATSHPDHRPHYVKSLRRLTWPNGAIAMCYSAEDPEQLRGPQQDLAWADEMAKWRYAEDTWSNLEFGLRLGNNPRALITTTPRPIKLLKEILKDPSTHVTRVSTYANRAHLAKTFFSKIIKKYEGTRLGRQELLAELLDDNPYALWKREDIEKARVKWPKEQIVRTVVAIDPPVTSGENADECGIIVAGITAKDDNDRCRVYVLADATIQGASPSGWAQHAINQYHVWQADAIVAEVNQGGDMVETTIQAQSDTPLPVKKVRASKGKVTRAEPVAALYEQGLVSHVGTFAKLEDQCCEFTSDFKSSNMGYSPDRVDALVWALTELVISPAGKAAPRIRTL